MNKVSQKLTKRATGIPGLDHMTRGGLPARSATLVVGGAGAGKTVLCLQILAAGIQRGGGAVVVSAQRRRQFEDEIEDEIEGARASMEQARGRAERLERELEHDRREQSELESDSVRHDRDVRRARGESAKADRDGPPPDDPGRGGES